MKLGNASASKLAAARVRAARGNVRWVEIEDDLVERDGGRVYVSASSDLMYQLERGTIFENGSANLVADHAELHFVVRPGDELVVLQRRPGTWSQETAKRHLRASRRKRAAS